MGHSKKNSDRRGYCHILSRVPLRIKSTICDLVYFTTPVPDTSDTNPTRAIQVRHKQHKWDTSVKRVLLERHEFSKSATQTTRVRSESKGLIFDNVWVKTYFHIFILAIWQMKDSKERNIQQNILFLFHLFLLIVDIFL